MLLLFGTGGWTVMGKRRDFRLTTLLLVGAHVLGVLANQRVAAVKERALPLLSRD